jgi:hypothetical protein
MADKTIRFITAWNGYKPGDTLTDDEAIKTVYRNSGSQAEPIWTKLADAA